MTKNKNVKSLLTYLPIHLFTLKKKPAFTLAEVLITLGIIGVVAAMTIPNLIAKYQDHVTVVKLKETYSIFTQAIRMAEEEYGTADGWGITGRDEEGANIVAEKLKPFLKITLDCGTIKEDQKRCVGDSYRYCSLNESTAVCEAKNDVSARISQRYFLTLNNGALITLSGGEGAKAGSTDNRLFYVKVDTTGKEVPNKGGYDQFELIYYKDKGLMPNGEPSISQQVSSYKTTCMSRSQVGYGCAYYVLTFGNRDYLRKK